MTCLFITPVEALNAVLICTQAALGTGPYEVPSQIVVGGDGAEDAFSCCDDGLLSITMDEIQRTEDSINRRKTSGDGPCIDKAVFNINVKVRHCIETFKKDRGGGATSGASITPEQRTLDSLQNVEEAWILFQALACCAAAKPPTGWSGCDIEVISNNTIPVQGQCFGHNTILRVTLKMCCPPITTRVTEEEELA